MVSGTKGLRERTDAQQAAKEHRNDLSSVGWCCSGWVGQGKAETGEWMDAGGGSQEISKEMERAGQGAMEEGVMRLEDQRVQLQASLAGGCVRESSRRSMCSRGRSSDARQGSTRGCSSREVASETGAKIVNSIAELFEQINYVNAACSLFNEWKITEAYIAKQTAIKAAASAHVCVHLDTKSLLPRARTVCFSYSN